MDNVKILLAGVAMVFSISIATSSQANGNATTSTKQYFDLGGFAAPLSAESYFDGAYLGIGAGAAHAWPDIKSSYSEYVIDLPIGNKSTAHNFNHGEYNLNADVFAGYGRTFHSLYYFGGEIFANYFNSKMEGTHSFSATWGVPPGPGPRMTTDVKSPYSFGGNLRAGYLVWPRMMFYVLFGLNYAKFDVNSEVIDTTPASLIWKPVINKFNKWQLGFMPGIGVETNLTDHLLLGAQYTYTFFPSFDHSTSFIDGWWFNPDVSVQVDLKTKIRPKSDLLTLRLSYLFNSNSETLGTLPVVQVKSNFDGAYFGVGAGAVHIWPNAKSSYSALEDVIEYPEYPEKSSHDFRLGGYNLTADVFAGCGKVFQSPYYLGGEIFANYFGSKAKGSHDLIHDTYGNILNMMTTVKNPYSFGGDLRTGYLIWPRMMIYVLFGLDYAKFDVKSEAIDSGEKSISRMLITNEFNKWRLGYMPGIGMEMGLNDRMSLRAQYAYTFYPSFSHDTSIRDPGRQNFSPSTVSLKTKIKPYRDTFTVMLSYLF